jgi:hypothetical protein
VGFSTGFAKNIFHKLGETEIRDLKSKGEQDMNSGNEKLKTLGALVSSELYAGEDMGDMKSRDIGKLTTAGLVREAEEILEENGNAPEAVVLPKKGRVPGTLEGQNLGHNAKKEGLGRNTSQQ